MKKIRLFIVLALVICLCACGGSSNLEELLELGAKYLDEQNYEEAIIAFTEAIEIDPKRIDAYIGLADVYYEQGMLEEEIEILIKAYEIDEKGIILKRIERNIATSGKYVDINIVSEMKYDFSVDGISLGDDISLAKMKYSSRDDYCSNTMGEPPDYNDEDTVYSMPFMENAVNGHSNNEFGYIFVQDLDGSGIDYFLISSDFPNNNLLCMNQFFTGESSSEVLKLFGCSDDWSGIPDGKYMLFEENKKFLKVEVVNTEISKIIYGYGSKVGEIRFNDNKIFNYTASIDN